MAVSSIICEGVHSAPPIAPLKNAGAAMISPGVMLVMSAPTQPRLLMQIPAEKKMSTLALEKQLSAARAAIFIDPQKMMTAINPTKPVTLSLAMVSNLHCADAGHTQVF
mmetsp:Transcript_17785/g.32253  ORF Transcript_17785/g.32253 Transcript_17785/m.32253 type:complete len:109 (+) Transcript_17785:131-457(+)